MVTIQAILLSLRNILFEMFDNGLMNLHSTTHLSLPLLLLLVALAYGCSWNLNWDELSPAATATHARGFAAVQVPFLIREACTQPCSDMKQHLESHLLLVLLHLRVSMV